MGSRTIIMIAMAGVFAVVAVFAGRTWLDRQAAARLSALGPTAPVETTTIVVASKPLRFGTEITSGNIREVRWPAEALPAGTYAKVDELLGAEPRIVLAGLEENEPVLSTKITGAGARATLSAVIEPQMRAVTVGVNDVQGVGGFVLPGDRVDVVMIRRFDDADSYSEIVLQNLRVLAVDQSADDRQAEPVVVKAVTLEVTADQAQRLTLASSVGTLSLALRAAGQAGYADVARVSEGELGTGAVAPSEDGDKAPNRLTLTVGVVRAGERMDYVVPSGKAVADRGEPKKPIPAPPTPIAMPAKPGAPTSPVSQAPTSSAPRG
ncbi:MAG: Flp pilus assembly protein CpaB [Hyphomicrobiales bacterium]|nr:Flp pilus assembly protein CpaB [Hyphomicrobiales bacterium]